MVVVGTMSKCNGSCGNNVMFELIVASVVPVGVMVYYTSSRIVSGNTEETEIQVSALWTTLKISNHNSITNHSTISLRRVYIMYWMYCQLSLVK